MLLVPSASIPPPAGAQFTCHQMLLSQRQLFVGTSTGAIIAYRRRIDSHTGVEQVDSKPLTLEGHTGAIRRLLRAEVEGLGGDGCLLISASADRTIRIWDPSVREVSKMCVQTLRGHGGTVTSLVFAENVLITSSTDRTIKLWRPDEGRDLMLYPWFTPQQTLTDLDCWVSTPSHMSTALGLGLGLTLGPARPLPR